MQVMILAAGRSTRLGALGLALPKPLVPICGYPAIAFGLALCRSAGLLDVVINVHHHRDRIQQALSDGSRYGLRIRYSVEPELLGTGGGIAEARRLFVSEPVLVMNGKVVADVDLGALIAAHRAAPAGTVATLVTREDLTSEDVTVDGKGRVIGLRGGQGAVTHPGHAAHGDTTRMCQFTGIHVIESAPLNRLPRGVSDIVGDAYIPALASGERIQAFPLAGYFAEHSTPERYLAGNLALLAQPGLVAHPPGPLAGVDRGANVHSTARLIGPYRIAAGAVVETGAVVGPGVVLGPNARVAAGVRVTRAVLWESAVAAADCADAIITHAETVVPVGRNA
jgi:mannose-1-phosphate guanylyltransferase